MKYDEARNVENEIVKILDLIKSIDE